MAIFYVDFDNGNDTDDGTDPAPQGGGVGPWATIGKAATTLTAGNTARVRGGMTETLTADVLFTNDGTKSARCVIEGIYTAAGSDDWGDGNVARPILDFNGGAFSFQINGDDFWTLSGLDITGSIDFAAMWISNSAYVTLDDVRIYDNGANTGDDGLSTGSSPHTCLNNCVFDNNYGANVLCISGSMLMEGCTITGDDTPGVSTNSSDYGLETSNSLVYMKDCTFGVGDADAEHETSDIRCVRSRIYGRNCILDSTTQVIFGDEGGWVNIEDNGQVHLAFKSWFPQGTLEKDTGEAPPSGAGWAIQANETSACDVEVPLLIEGDWLRGIPIYLDGTEQTITVKIKCLDADWTDGAGTGGRPSAAELFIELDYNDGAASWATVQSTEACVDDTYTSFTVTITPNAAGPAYLKAKVLVYDTTGGGAPVYVDPIPTFS